MSGDMKVLNLLVAALTCGLVIGILHPLLPWSMSADYLVGAASGYLTGWWARSTTA